MKKSSYLELRICFFSYNVIKILKMFNKRNVIDKKLMKSKSYLYEEKKSMDAEKILMCITIYNIIQYT